MIFFARLSLQAMNGYKIYYKYYLITILFFVVAIVWYAVLVEDTGELMVAFLDVGQGDAIFIQAPNGNQVLFDGGPNKAVLRELSEVMPFYDRSIDLLILSHPNKDHIAGLVEVLERFDVGSSVEPGTSHTIAEYAEWERMIESNGVDRIFGKSGMRIYLAEDIYIDILSPKEGEKLIGKNVNDVMLTGRLVYGGTSFLLTGDMERPLEHTLLTNQVILEANVLKVAHHGSKNSSTEYFLSKVSPEYAVIQVGKSNRYGHPHQETLNKLQLAGINILRTDIDGRIIFKSDGDRLILQR